MEIAPTKVHPPSQAETNAAIVSITTDPESPIRLHSMAVQHHVFGMPLSPVTVKATTAICLRGTIKDRDMETGHVSVAANTTTSEGTALTTKKTVTAKGKVLTNLQSKTKVTIKFSLAFTG